MCVEGASASMIAMLSLLLHCQNSRKNVDAHLRLALKARIFMPQKCATDA